MEHKFRLHEWVFCEFKLVMIVEMEEGRVTSVSDGITRLSGFDLSDRCFPLHLEVKKVSDWVADIMDKLHENTVLNLNYPDLHRELVRRWVEACKLVNQPMELKRWYDLTREFRDDIFNRIRSLRDIQVHGVSLLRQ